MIRLAFVGVDHPHGAHWRQLLGNVADRAQITALVPGYGYRPDGQGGKGGMTSLEERFAQLPRFASVGDLLAAAEFDAAVVCLSNKEGPLAIAELLKAGKPVLAEKPVGMSAEQVLPILEAVYGTRDPLAAEKAVPRVAFQTGYMWRYDELATRLRIMHQEGRFGKLISAELTFVTSDIRRRGADHYLFDPAESGGGFFSWLACHFLDLLFYVTGESVVGVTARTGQFGVTDVPVEDGGVAVLDLSGGGIATFLGGYWLPRWAGESHWRIRGSERWVEWQPGRPGTGGAIDIHGPQPQWHAMEESFSLPVDATPGYGGRRGLALVTDWLDAISSGRNTCRNTALSMFHTLSLLDAIAQSSRDGRRVETRIG